tara:strand:+ start:4367 stop:4996 length:630 start_codon:yes stop_codon:yes gene_type:complete
MMKVIYVSMAISSVLWILFFIGLNYSRELDDEKDLDIEKSVVENININKHNYHEEIPELPSSISNKELFDKCIQHIKMYESFSEKMYLDNDGSQTIGYGHHIMSYDTINIVITEDEADRLLREDFNKYIGYAKKYTDTYNKQLALGMFLYNVGETKFASSTLRRLIDNNLPIDNEIVKWHHFHKDGKKLSAKVLLRRREFELFIFNLNT